MSNTKAGTIVRHETDHWDGDRMHHHFDRVEGISVRTQAQVEQEIQSRQSPEEDYRMTNSGTQSQGRCTLNHPDTSSLETIPEGELSRYSNDTRPQVFNYCTGVGSVGQPLGIQAAAKAANSHPVVF